MAMEKQDYVAVGGQVPTPAKFSRYRSVRKAASNNAPEMTPLNTSIPPVPSHPSSSDPVSHESSDCASGSTPTIKKSMSRYRRQKAPSASLPPNVPPTPSLQTPMDQRAVFQAKSLSGANGNTSPSAMRDKEQEERERDRQAAMDRLTGGCTKSPASPSSYQRPTTRGRAATDRDLRRGAEDRVKADNAASRRHSSNEPKWLSFREAMKFSRSKERTSSGSSAGSPTETSPAAQFPGIDAPISAVNAGERRVLVQYKKISLKLIVTPSTTAQDILVSAASCVSGEIEPLRFILIESYTASGLERPLRRYECVRDVLNSWAHDGENSLIIVPAASADALSLIDPQYVSTKPPEDATFHIYYSQRPRKWDKRYVTLRSDGQITVSKKETGKEQTNACHLSDFDIYSPTSTYLSQTVKPPKKICYAIKSQQKSSMFISTENFIHFFATNDKSIAEGWYRAVQTWRSWYLVNKLGAGRVEDNGEPEAGVVRSQQNDASQTRPIKPLLASIDTYSSEEKETLQESTVDRPKTQRSYSRKRSSRDHGPPPSSFPKSFANEGEPSGAQSGDDSPFTSSGLLGRTYTLRQRAMKEREEREKRDADELFNQGLVGAATERRQFSTSRPGSRSNTMTSAQAPDIDGLVKRSQSVHQGKPLVDLTPIYQEPPQHNRKGRGVTVDPGMPLIDAATSREASNGIAIPPAKTWRRPPFPADPHQSHSETQTRNRSNTARSVNSRYRHPNTTPDSASPISPIDLEQPFVPNSLLARTGFPTPAPGAPIGHGVATGDRNATKPMLDMSPQSPFAQGSLLRGL